MKKSQKVKKAERLAMLITLLVITALLFIPFFNKIFIGIFGYAVYAYIVSLYCILFCLAKNYKLALPRKRVGVYILLFFCFLLTLHIFFAKDLIANGYGSYIIDTFTTNTVGGMILSLVSFFVVPMGYLASIIIFFLLTSIIGFVAIFPYLVKNKTQKGKKLIKKNTIEKNDCEVPKNNISQSQLKIIDITEEVIPEPPLNEEDFLNEPKPLTKEDAKKMLFGQEISRIDI